MRPSEEETRIQPVEGAPVGDATDNGYDDDVEDDYDVWLNRTEHHFFDGDPVDSYDYWSVVALDWTQVNTCTIDNLMVMVYYSTAEQWSKPWGVSSDIAVQGDIDGDSRDDLVIWRPSNGTWYVLRSSLGYADPQSRWTKAWGVSGDVPLCGDLDGDGADDLIIWRPSNGTWYALLSSLGFADPASRWTKAWGMAGDGPYVMDVNGDGRVDPTVY